MLRPRTFRWAAIPPQKTNERDENETGSNQVHYQCLSEGYTMCNQHVMKGWQADSDRCNEYYADSDFSASLHLGRSVPLMLCDPDLPQDLLYS